MGARRLSTSITKLHTPLGDTVSTIPEVTATCRHFYENLYSRDKVNNSKQTSLLSHLTTSLSFSEAKELDSVISPEEIAKAIQDSALSSSPGQDGIPFEFYKAFTHILSPFLASMYTNLLNGGFLPSSTSQSMITLIFKNKGSELDLRN
jgi:hypothetical protein